MVDPRSPVDGVPNRVWRLLLPGLAFKGIIIGGGYATGRELAEFFLPSGPWGGIMGILLAMAVWSAVGALTFVFAHRFSCFDYSSFFSVLLGQGWIAFEIVFLIFLILILAVFGAAAGEIGSAVLDLPPYSGTLALMGMIAFVAAFGNWGAERLFSIASVLLYAVYIVFAILIFSRYHGDIATAFSDVSTADTGWIGEGLTFAGYNVVAAIMVLPMLRHLSGRKEVVTAGLVVGPLAALPALVFFIAMTAFPPAIGEVALPSDMMLSALDLPWFRYAFQMMIFIALLESGVGGVNALNERLALLWAKHREKSPGAAVRALFTGALLTFCMFVANSMGMIALIASGYRLLAWAIILIFIVPLCTIGIIFLRRNETGAR